MSVDDCGPVEEDEPLFRARLIGIGYDPERQLVLHRTARGRGRRRRTAARARRERRPRRAAVRDAGAGAGDGRATASRRSARAGRAARCATSRWIPTGTSAPLELTAMAAAPNRAGPTADRSRRHRARGAARRRGRGARPDAVVVERDVPREPRARRRRDARDLQAAAWRTAAVGLPARHVVPPRGRGVRGLGGARVGHRSRHRAARRPGRRRDDAAVRRTTIPKSTTSRCSRRTPTTSGAWPRSTS